MSTEHTAGPWVLLKKQPHQDFYEIQHESQQPGAASLVVARVTCRPSWAQEQTANALLITAAPDLLEALVAARSELWRLLDARGIEPKQAREWPEIVRAEEAIAKAYRGSGAKATGGAS